MHQVDQLDVLIKLLLGVLHGVQGRHKTHLPVVTDDDVRFPVQVLQVFQRHPGEVGIALGIILEHPAVARLVQQICNRLEKLVVFGEIDLHLGIGDESRFYPPDALLTGEHDRHLSQTDHLAQNEFPFADVAVFRLYQPNVEIPLLKNTTDLPREKGITISTSEWSDFR